MRRHRSNRVPACFAVTRVMGALVVGVAALAAPTLGWVQEEATIIRPAKTSQPAAKSATDDLALKKKLGEILANQAAILKKLDAIMEELRVIKVRAIH